MGAHRGRWTALIVSILGIAVLAVAGIAARRRLLEEWYTWQFDRAAEEEKLEAAVKLGELGSDRAVGWLYEELVETYERNVRGDCGQQAEWRIITGNPERFFGQRGRRLRALLAAAGHLALHELFQGLAAQGINEPYVCRSTLDAMSPEVWARPETIRTLERLASDPSEPAAVGETAREVIEWLASKR